MLAGAMMISPPVTIGEATWNASAISFQALKRGSASWR